MSTCDGARGLPSAEVRALARDDEGFLWIGTLGGLARYDGHTVKTYLSASTPGLAGDRIVSLMLASDGALWIATERGGVSRRADGRFEQILEQGVHQRRTRLIEHPDGSVWVGGHRLTRVGPGLEVETFDEVDPSRGEGPDEPTFVALPDGRVLAVLSSAVYELRRQPELLQAMASSGAFLDSGGCLWFTNCPEHRPIPGVDSRPIPEELDVYPTFGTVPLGEHSVLQLGLYATYEVAGSGADVVWRKLDCDDNPRTGLSLNGGRTLLLGTGRSGLKALVPAEATPVPLKGVRGPEPSVAQIVELESCAVAFETIGGTAWMVRDDGSAPIRGARWGNDLQAGSGAAPLPGGCALVICQDGLARVGPGGDFVVLDEATAEVGLSALTRAHLYHGNEANWLWLDGALRPIDDDGRLRGEPVPIDVQPELFSRAADAVHFVAGNDVIRFDESAGVLHRVLTLDQVLLRAVHLDGQGALWVSSYGDGLYRRRADGRLDHWTRGSTGLPDDFLGFVVVLEGRDGSPRVWVNSNSGVITMAVAALDAVLDGSAETLISHRILTPEMNSASGAIANDGRLLFPTIAGLQSIDPRRVNHETPALSVTIESLTLDGARAASGEPLTARTGADLEVAYTAVALPSSADCRFQHRLRPFESEWVDAGPQRTTRYTSLPADDYTFEVRAMSPGGPWSEPVVAGTAVRVLPRWHERTTFRIGALVLAGLLSSLLVHQRTISLRRRNAALAAEVARRQALESELVASRADHVAVLETARDGILSVDRDWHVLYANEALLTMLGRHQVDVIGRTVEEIGLEGVKASLVQALDVAPGQAEPGPLSFSGFLRRADGTAMEVEVSAAAEVERLGPTMESAKGRLTIIVRNVSERTRMLEQLRREEERFRTLFRTAPSAILVIRPSLELLDWNERAAAAFGLPVGSSGGRTMDDVFLTDRARDEFRAAIERVLDGDGEVELAHSVGLPHREEPSRLRWRFAPIVDADGQALSVICLAADVTDQERAAVHLEHLRRRLVHAEETERSRLARELHDDLSQRLAALALELQVAYRSEQADSSSIPTDVIVPIQREIQDVARDVHALSRQLHPTVLEDLGLARALRSECERRTRAHGVDVTFDDRSLGASAGPEVDLALFRIAQESIQNALRHGAPANVAVTLETGRTGELILGVEDDGVGFDLESGDVQKGLGIASMGERARLVAACLEIRSTPGEGTVVSVTAPTLEANLQP